MTSNLIDLPINEIWSEIERIMNENPEPILNLTAVYQYDLQGEAEETYQLHLANGSARVIREQFTEPDCTLKMKPSTFKKLLTGTLNSTAAFMTGKLKVKGNMGLALKLDSILSKYTFGNQGEA